MTQDIKACCSHELNSFQALIRSMSETVRNLYPVYPSGAMTNLMAPLQPLSAIHMIGKTWEPGRTLTVGFLEGSATQRKKVQRWAEEWLRYANLKFRFDISGRADLRVAFNPRAGSWSNVGSDALAILSGPTINFGWVTDTSDDISDRAVILHEFGHAIGLGHEQSSPDQDIRWNKEAALRYYMQTQGWSAQMVIDNVFNVFDRSQVAGTVYDRTSIMQYPVPTELTTDGRGIGWNTELSALDIEHIAQMYPGVYLIQTPTATPTPTPTTPPVPPKKPLPPGLVEVVIGKPAAKVAIPRPGQPARFSLNVPTSQVIDLGVVVEHGRGREPVVVVKEAGTTTPLTLGLVNGRGLFQFDAGVYVLEVFNPFSALAGTAWVKASTR
jgi:hypothetical protein